MHLHGLEPTSKPSVHPKNSSGLYNYRQGSLQPSLQNLPSALQDARKQTGLPQLLSLHRGPAGHKSCTDLEAFRDTMPEDTDDARLDMERRARPLLTPVIEGWRLLPCRTHSKGFSWSLHFSLSQSIAGLLTGMRSNGGQHLNAELYSMISETMNTSVDQSWQKGFANRSDAWQRGWSCVSA